MTLSGKGLLSIEVSPIFFFSDLLCACLFSAMGSYFFLLQDFCIILFVLVFIIIIEKQIESRTCAFLIVRTRYCCHSSDLVFMG